MPLRFGLTTPVVTLVPRHRAAWEASAGPLELRRIAEAADRLGYHHLGCSEHVAIPAPVAEVRGGCYYDPAATLGFFAACTSRIRLLTHVLVLPYHHPLAVAKRYGTLDRLSGGRVVLGVGIGSLGEEFALVGAEFAARGPRFEDALRALRAALGESRPRYDGTHYRFADFVVEPAAVQTHLPIWLGGRTPRSLRRALRLADGWDPFRYSADELEDLLPRAREWKEWRDRTLPFCLALSPEHPFDAVDDGQRSRVVDTVARYQRMGAAVLNLRFRSASLDHYLEQLDAFASQVAPHFA
jgi:probable F420-dependent oxidoreductase